MEGAWAMKDKEAAVRELMRKVFARIHDSKEAGFEQKQYDFAFHVFETLAELEALTRVGATPDRYSEEEAEVVVRAVLYHSTGHLVAAARLYDKFIDSFGVGDEQEV